MSKRGCNCGGGKKRTGSRKDCNCGKRIGNCKVKCNCQYVVIKRCRSGTCVIDRTVDRPLLTVKKICDGRLCC